MSKMLANLYLFCENHREVFKTIEIKNGANKTEVTLSCDSVEFETSQYETLNVVIDKGSKVQSYMLQGCQITYEGARAVITHANQPYIEIVFM
jgi:hypothetical protein